MTAHFSHRGHHRLPFPALALAIAAFGRHHRGGWGGTAWRGGPWGGGPFGPPHGGRRFGRGDLKYVILDLLGSGPRHGYDVIRALEERFHGFYTPSAGSVYPSLQLLEDQGYVTSSQQDGKRIYSITDDGRTFLKERASTVDDLHARTAEWWPKLTPELHELADDVRQVGQLLFSQAKQGGLHDPERIRRIREVVTRARRDIEAVFAGRNVSNDDML